MVLGPRHRVEDAHDRDPVLPQSRPWRPCGWQVKLRFSRCDPVAVGGQLWALYPYIPSTKPFPEVLLAGEIAASTLGDGLMLHYKTQ